MSYNGSGTFVINSAGTPYVSGTVISSTAANALNSDLATGLSTAICKDGQTTPTANIPLGGFKITNLGAGTVASDAARLSQVQNSTTTTLISITGTDTITGTVSPTLTAYATGQVFSFVVAATNTGAVTLNIDSIGVKSVTRTGAVALVAGDLVTGQIAIVEYDGTRFQLINGNSFTNLKITGALTGMTTPLTVAQGGTGLTTVPHTVQVFTSGSGTYTLPANCKAIKVTMVGGGGGGGGGGGSAGGGGAGGTSTFGTSFLTAFGGSTSGSPTAGAGSSVPTGGDVNLTGSAGVQGADFRYATQFCPGGTGAASILGGSGIGGYVNTGSSGYAGTGGGGGGGGISAAQFTGGGGAAGGALYKLISSPSATYSYAVGAGGTAGTAGTSGYAGGAGGSGAIIVEEFYV